MFFGAVSITKNANIDKHGYSGYGIGFDRGSIFSFPGTGCGQNVLIFRVDMSFSSHINNKKKDISILNTLTAEEIYSINFTVTKKKFCLILH